MNNISHEEIKAARKAHHCDWCGEPIAVGEWYVRQRNKDGSDIWTWRAHQECYRASCTLDDFDRECKTGYSTRGCTCEKGNTWCNHELSGGGA